MNTNTSSARARPVGRSTAFGGRRPDRVLSPRDMDRVDREARPLRDTPPDRPHAHRAPKRVPAATPPAVPPDPGAAAPQVAGFAVRVRRWAVRRSRQLSLALQALALSASRFLSGQPRLAIGRRTA